MGALAASHDTRAFEVEAQLSASGQLTETCARRIGELLDHQGFAVVTHVLSPQEADHGLKLVTATTEDPQRVRSTFASETDNHFRRRDFCPMPSSPEVLQLAGLLCRRLAPVMLEYCGRTRPVLEIATLTSYTGCSHQYIHRDPSGVLCAFVAVADVSAAQGGTVFIPATHAYSGSKMAFAGRVDELMQLAQLRFNMRIFVHNLRKIWALHRQGALGEGELARRLFSRAHDNHQPNILRFITGKSYTFHVFRLGPRTLWRLWRHRRLLQECFQPIQCAPAKGSVVLYRSDILHAGPDNVAASPRRFFAFSIARDRMDPEVQRQGYTPHPSLVASPKTLGDLLGAADRSTPA
jgi:ectoine hydroxylase-related dioxygenase (phytanoyl-CoA dioxygenase family)